MERNSSFLRLVFSGNSSFSLQRINSSPRIKMRWVCGVICALAVNSYVFASTSDWRSSLESGVAEYHRGHFAQAEALLRNALAGSRLEGTTVETADTLNYLGDVYISEERFASAEEVYTEALSLYKRSATKESHAIVITLCNLGTALSSEGFDDKALTVLNDALHRAKADPRLDADLRPHISISLGIVYARRHNTKKAESLFLDALRARIEAGKTDFVMANALNDLAEAHREERKYADAEKEYQRSIEIMERVLGPSHPEVAIPYSNLGQLYVRMKRFGEAEDRFLRSLQITETTSPLIPPRIVRILHLLSDAYFHEDKYKEAEETLARAADIARHNPDRDPETPVVLDAYAEALKRSGKTEEARSTHMEADRMRTMLSLTVSVKH
jgi:tetratricopeptide (TPR) repeat protein